MLDVAAILLPALALSHSLPRELSKLLRFNQFRCHDILSTGSILVTSTTSKNYVKVIIYCGAFECHMHTFMMVWLAFECMLL